MKSLFDFKMRANLKKRLPPFLKKVGSAVVAVLAIFFVSLLYKSRWMDDKMMLALVSGIIAGYLGFVKQQMEQDAMFRSLFDSFNAKYCKETNDLLECLRQDQGRKIEVKERNLLIDYFNLCAEEFLWFKRGRIPNDVWQAWKNGMLVNLEIEQVKLLFDCEINTVERQISYYGLAKELGFPEPIRCEVS